MSSSAQQAIAHEDENKIKIALEERFQQWLAAENSRDAAMITSLYDENAILMPSREEPVIGKAAIGEWARKLVADPRFVPFTLSLDWNSFHLIGDIAIMTSVFESDMTRGEKHIHYRGKLLIVWKKQKDDSWKIFRYMYDEIPGK